MSKYTYKENESAPHLCISSLIQRGADMAYLIRIDGKELAGAGLDLSITDDIEGLVKQCSDMEADWQIAFDDRVKANNELKEFTYECNRFRNAATNLIKMVNAIKPVTFIIPRFQRGYSRADLVQDLHTLHVIFRDFKNDLSLLPICDEYEKQAFTRSSQLSEMISDAEIRRTQTRNLRLQRNLMSNRLYEMIKEVTAAGRMAFRGDPRLVNYHYDRLY